MSHMAAAYVADYTSKKHDGTKACGGFSGAAMNSVDQNRSTIFDVEPAVKKMSTGQLPKSRVAEDEKLSNPYRQQYVPPPRPVSTMAPGPVDISDMSIADPLAEAQARQMEEAKKFDVEATLENLRAALRARGAVGIRGLARNFQICDTDGSKKLDRDELAKCLRLCKIQLTAEQFDTLFDEADSDGSGLVDYDEFLKVVRGRLPLLRRKLVVSIFNGIDQRARKDNKGRSDGKLTQEDLRDFYSAKDHPEVRAGKKTEGQVLSEMMSTFEGKHGNKDGVVTLEEWIGYVASKQGSRTATRQALPHPTHTLPSLHTTGTMRRLAPPWTMTITST